MNINVTGLKDVKKYLKKFPDETFKVAKKYLADAVLNADAQTKKNATNILTVRSGALRRSVQSLTTGSNLDNIKSSLFTAGKVSGQPIKYAPIHEYGGTITAKNAYKGVPGGPYLNIPTDQNKTPAGVMRLNARQVFERGGYIRGRSVWLGDEMQFYLVKQVTIKPRLGMNKAADDQIPNLLINLQNTIGES